MIDEDSDVKNTNTVTSDLTGEEGMSRKRRQVDEDRFQYLPRVDEGSGDEGGQFLSYGDGDYYTDETFVDQEAGYTELKIRLMSCYRNIN